MNFQKYLKWAVSFHKYPRYIADLYINLGLQSLWRHQGVQLGANIIWYGKPILSMCKSSSISIGKGCVICSRSSQTALGVSHPVIFRTLKPGAELHIGSNVRMSGTTICAADKIIIGDRCVIGSNVTIADTDFHSLDPEIRSSLEDSRFAKTKSIEIGSDVFIGGGSIILKGVCIGRGSVIGANSVVTKSISERVIVAGNPARPIGKIQSSTADVSSEYKKSI